MRHKWLIAGMLLASSVAHGQDWDDYAALHEGMHDYYDGLCYRARPYLEGPEDEAAQWEKGFRLAQKRDHDRVDRSYCGGSRLGSTDPPDWPVNPSKRMRR